MLLFGHRFIDAPHFYHVDDIDAISHTPANSTLLIPFDEANLDIMAHCRENGVRFAVEAASLREAVYAENLGAAYIVVEEPLAKRVQKTAETYLFDAKVLCRIEEEDQIEEMAAEGIDGVLFAGGVIKISG